MANKCKTKKNDKSTWWESALFRDGTPVPDEFPQNFNDGLIGVFNKTSSTALTGRHDLSGRDLDNVRCTGSGTEDLSFTRVSADNLSFYDYSGRVIDSPDGTRHIISGGRYQRFPINALTKTRRRKKALPPPDEEGTWQGQKPIT